MALWDYHVLRGPSYVGLSDAELASVRARHPRGRVIESVEHLPRVAGDDATDHILRHRYGVDPASYRATIEYRIPTAKPAERAKQRSAAVARAPRRAAPRRSAPVKGRAAELRLTLSRLVKLALRESPSLTSTLDRLVASHLRKGATSSRASFIGFPLVIRSSPSSVRVAFASER